MVNGGEKDEERVGSPFAGMNGVCEVALGLGKPVLALASGGSWYLGGGEWRRVGALAVLASGG